MQGTSTLWENLAGEGLAEEAGRSRNLGLPGDFELQIRIMLGSVKETNDPPGQLHSRGLVFCGVTEDSESGESFPADSLVGEDRGHLLAQDSHFGSTALFQQQ